MIELEMKILTVIVMWNFIYLIELYTLNYTHKKKIMQISYVLQFEHSQKLHILQSSLATIIINASCLNRFGKGRVIYLHNVVKIVIPVKCNNT